MLRGWASIPCGLACCFQLEAAGQTHFNRRYDALGQFAGEGAWAVEEVVDGEYLVIISSPWIDTTLSWYYSSVVTALRLAVDGEVLETHHVNIPQFASYPGWSNSADRMGDGRVVVGGNTYGQDGSSRPALFIIGPDGVVQNWWAYGDTGQYWAGRQAKQAPDGGFVLCGETSSNGGNQNDAFLLKTDAQGDQEWVQTYGGVFNDYANAIDLNGTQGYFMGGQYRVSSGNKNLWVKSLDVNGEEDWNKVWGSGWDEPNAHLTTAADGHVLVASAWGLGPNWLLRRYLAKLDKEDGSIIWERQYAAPVYTHTFYVVQEVEPGGDLIAAGDDGIEDATLGVLYRGCLLRTTSTGDSLWMRYYTYYDDAVPVGRGFFRDVQPTSDGGFIAVGQALQVGPYSSDTWVVKTDQYGCIEPGCQLIMGVETQITNLRDVLTVFPNPVASGGNVQVSIALPAGFRPQGQLRLTVTDALGRIVQEQSVPQGISTLSLPNLQPSTGSYHLHLSDATRWISGAKLLVE